MQPIADWLENLGLGQYAQRFAENDIDFDILSEDLTLSVLDRHVGEVYQHSPISNSPGRRAGHAESARLGIWFGSPLMSALGQQQTSAYVRVALPPKADNRGTGSGHVDVLMSVICP